jgi:hypothetical protein
MSREKTGERRRGTIHCHVLDFSEEELDGLGSLSSERKE